MPAWPVFETLVIVLIVTGAIYYAVSVRGRAADVEADFATGEANDRLIGIQAQLWRRDERSARRLLMSGD